VGSDKKERPSSEVKIVSVVVFTNPIPEADALLEQFIANNMKQRVMSSQLKAVPSTGSSSGAARVAPSNTTSATADGASIKVRKLG
jgi:hypothetical protein